jgi:Fe2+ or Zn2+ uptake regulation protein
MNTQAIFEQSLRTAGQSITMPRQAVFNALQHHRSLTMRELVNACPTINRASVYRTVELFEKFEIISRIPSGWKYRLELGEKFLEHHHHATCSNCGASIALPEDKSLEVHLNGLAAKRHFVLHSHQIELIGLCEACS